MFHGGTFRCLLGIDHSFHISLFLFLQYGWEFPAQLLVIMIVFTYAVICPVIVPFGMLYFGFSLIVYKKQILYVYQPVYESGGAMFPGALQKTLFGLTCGQLTFIGKTGATAVIPRFGRG